MASQLHLFYIQNNPAPDDANKRKKELVANLLDLDRVSLLVTDPAHANYMTLVCVFIPICKREISILFGDHRGSSFQNELIQFRRVNADSTLERFQHKVTLSRRNQL